MRSNSVSKYLLDASAIYPLLLKLRENFLLYVDRFVVLDLTVYEVGNTIWKEFRKNRIKDPEAVTKLFEEIFRRVTILRTSSSLYKVVELAIRENITFYEASYLYIARINNLKLVTEDSDLLRYPESIDIEQLLKELAEDHKE